MQMRMIRQISNTDCAIAALAMVLDKNYDTVLFDIGTSLVTENGLNEMYVRKYLWENGCIIMQKDRYNLIHRTDAQKNNATLNVNANWPPDLLDAPRCLLLVDTGHWVAVDHNKVVYDPFTGVISPYTDIIKKKTIRLMIGIWRKDEWSKLVEG